MVILTRTRNIFNFFTKLLGVNFSSESLSGKSYLACFIAINTFNSYLSFYITITEHWFEPFRFYSITNFYQMVLPFFVQNFLILRAFQRRKIQKNLYNELKPKFTQKTDKCERKFLLRILFILFVRILKLGSGRSRSNLIFNAQALFPELIYSSNDLMFVYYVELMVEYLDFINRRILMMRTYKDLRGIKRDILHVFELKRRIIKQYSIDIFITIFYTFILCIINFYWILMRAIFHHLEKINEIATFWHLFVPIFMFWIICSRCDKYYKKVGNKV